MSEIGRIRDLSIELNEGRLQAFQAGVKVFECEPTDFEEVGLEVYSSQMRSLLTAVGW